MKKKILITLAVLALFVFVLVSCGGGGSSCDHKWELSTTTANCTEAGEGTYVCSLCQAEEIRDQAALGHAFPAEANELKVANCSEGGYALYICSREGCGVQEKRHETKEDPSKHNYSEVTKQPTCTDGGFIKNICTWCEQEDGTYTPLPALGHTFTRKEPTGISITDAECEKDGFVTYKCQECDLPEIVKTVEDLTGEDATAEDKALGETLRALEHKFTEIANPSTDIVLPTCTTAGHTVYTCANGCGTTQPTAGTAPEELPLGHTYERVGGAITLVVTLDPTCCVEGFSVAKCGECDHYATADEYTENEDLCYVIPTISHFTGNDGDDYVEVTYHAATCTADSYWDVKCALDPNCTYGTGANGEAVATRPGTNFVEKLDHEWEIYVDVLGEENKPTCLTEGEWRYLCTRCDVYMLDGKTPAKNGISGAELLEQGYTVDKNGDALKENLAEELVKHIYTIGDYVKEPTCVSRGLYACTVCKRNDIVSYEDDVDYDYHNSGNNNTIGNTRVLDVIAPTCHSVGYTIYGCDHDYACLETKKDTYVAMTNHTFAPVTEDGVLVCTVAECRAAYRNVTSIYEKTPDQDFCLCGTCDEDNVTCGGSVSSLGTTKPKAPEAIGENYSKTLEKNIGKGIIELNAAAGTTFTVKVYNNGQEVDTLVNLNVTADQTGKAYIFLYDVAEVTSVEITASASATVSYYNVKEAF